MNRYDPGTPCLPLGLVAVAMTAATLGLLVVLPSQLEPESHVYFALAALTAASHTACDTVVSPACADWVADDGPALAPTSVRRDEPKCKQPG
jgi:hypothetical protein